MIISNAASAHKNRKNKETALSKKCQIVKYNNIIQSYIYAQLYRHVFITNIFLRKTILYIYMYYKKQLVLRKKNLTKIIFAYETCCQLIIIRSKSTLLYYFFKLAVASFPC